MRAGFTLVELSIVLVILGLLVGGVLAGQNLIRAAELRSITTEFSQWQTAVMGFREKYFALPGDMDNATAFWGAMTNCGTSSPASGSGTQTCNGNGDGFIDTGSANRNTEMFMFWQQLTAAGMIDGNYSGLAGTGSGWDANIGQNVPASKLSNGGWGVAYIGSAGVDYAVSQPSRLVEGQYGHVLAFGAANIHSTREPVLTPEEAWNIDTKIDDGLFGQGKVVGREYSVNCYRLADGSVGSASDTNPRADSTYRLDFDDTACQLVFRNAF